MTVCTHIQGWLNPEELVASVYDAVLDMGLQQRPVKVYDREVLQPRLTAWCCDSGEGYGYSGQITPAVAWPQKLLEVRALLEQHLGKTFPSVLINMYRDGNDSVSWHQDDERIFGDEVIIATISIGASRKFQLRNIRTKDKVEYILGDGDLLIMDAATNKEWEHCIPKTKKLIGPRISLTYRTMQGQ